MSMHYRIELEFLNVGFWGEGKTGVPGEKPLRVEQRTNNKLNLLMMRTEFENRTRYTRVEGERSHHVTIPASFPSLANFVLGNFIMDTVQQASLQKNPYG